MVNVLEVIRGIIEQKRAGRHVPDIALFREIMDYVEPGDWTACEARIWQLGRIGLIHIGPTRSCDYASLKMLTPILDRQERERILNRKSVVLPQKDSKTNKTRV